MMIIDTNDMKKFIDLVNKTINYLNEENPSESMSAHTKSIMSLLDTVKIENEKYYLKSDMYFYFLSYLSFLQAHMSSIIRETNYQDKIAVSIYWECRGLKSMFRKY